MKLLLNQNKRQKDKDQEVLLGDNISELFTRINHTLKEMNRFNSLMDNEMINNQRGCLETFIFAFNIALELLI